MKNLPPCSISCEYESRVMCRLNKSGKHEGASIPFVWKKVRAWLSGSKIWSEGRGTWFGLLRDALGIFPGRATSDFGLLKTSPLVCPTVYRTHSAAFCRQIVCIGLAGKPRMIFRPFTGVAITDVFFHTLCTVDSIRIPFIIFMIIIIIIIIIIIESHGSVVRSCALEIYDFGVRRCWQLPCSWLWRCTDDPQHWRPGWPDFLVICRDRFLVFYPPLLSTATVLGVVCFVFTGKKSHWNQRCGILWQLFGILQCTLSTHVELPCLV